MIGDPVPHTKCGGLLKRNKDVHKPLIQIYSSQTERYSLHIRRVNSVVGG